MIQFRASHAVALAMTAFAAASASAQTAGAYTVTSSPDMKVCTVAAGGAVSAFKTSDAGGMYVTKSDEGVVTITRNGEAVGHEAGTIAFRSAALAGTPADGQAHVIMKRSMNGEEPQVVEFSGEMKDGKMVVVTAEGQKLVQLDGKKLEALKAELMEATTVDSKDAKDGATKFHVKRPANTVTAGQMIEVPAEVASMGVARAFTKVDGQKMDGAMECRVIVRDHQ